jgi:Zn-dependent protease
MRRTIYREGVQLMNRNPHFQLFGVPVRIDPLFFLIPALSLRSRDLQGALIWTTLVFVGVLLHELGHALTMKRYGFSPFITLHGLGGLTHFPPGAQPTPRQNFFITFAGPGAGLALGGVVWLVSQVLTAPNPALETALRDALWINIGWSIVNLFPILPWDGGLLLDAGLAWATGKPQHKLVGVVSVVLGGGVVLLAIKFQMLLLGYFGAMGVLQGFNRLNAGSAAPVAPKKTWWERINADEDVERDLEFHLMTQASPEQRAHYAELLAWARLRKRNFHGARQAVKQMGPTFQPSVSLRARLAAAENDPEQVIALLSPEGAATDADLPLLVSSLLMRDRFDEVVKLGLARPAIADLASTRLFEAGAWAQSLELCAAERARTGLGRFAYNEACCLCRLGRLDDAVTALQKAKTLGCPELAGIQTDEDLEPVRDRPEVRELISAG